GQAKDAQWASAISDVPANTIRSLARKMAAKRTFIPMAWSLQRAEHGEQPYWAGILLMSVLGQFGMPGAGVGHGAGSLHTIGFMGRRLAPFKWGTFEQGDNPIDSVIPVARITDMLENPNQPFDYDGRALTYPDIKLIYWAGGNPFHHHQDLNRLRRAWQKPETVIVNEQMWTATAKHADIVFPITTTLERNDVALSTFDPYISPMPQIVAPYAESRNDYDVFRALSARLGIEEAFSENKQEFDWVKSIYEQSRARAKASGVDIPVFEDFWQGQHICLSDQFEEQQLILEAFREDPSANPLGTPSGKIELFSETIHSFAYDDCPGHPVWIAKTEALGTARAKKYPFHLTSCQPRNRLHSQLDFAEPSMSLKIAGREAARLNPQDAAAKGIKDGDTIRLFNNRGSCLAGAQLADEVMRNVIQLPTGAWYDPVETQEYGDLELSGNPNVLTLDIGTSSLAQGPSAHSCLVDVERYDGPQPDSRAYVPPPLDQS
ncbi:MAG: molybdopterin-dependent oxidoreductase, partial [Gammaproteobacteria bacterium]